LLFFYVNCNSGVKDFWGNCVFDKPKEDNGKEEISPELMQAMLAFLRACWELLIAVAEQSDAPTTENLLGILNSGPLRRSQELHPAQKEKQVQSTASATHQSKQTETLSL